MIIKRYLLNEIKNHLKRKEITFIVGPRQVGKTTLMLLLKDELEKVGERTVFLNLDIEYDKEYFTSQAKLINKIELEIGKKKGFVFIDEIQRKENAGLFLKGIYDMNLPYKFIVSGSGSAELKEKIYESLAGRKRIFELEPISFIEFVDFKTNYKYSNDLLAFFQVENAKLHNLLEEYLNFGGYPQIVLETELNEKRKLINEIYRSYIERDISYLLKLRKTEAFSNLVKLMAKQIGKLINYNELSSTLGISVKTIKDFLWYLEKTFIIRRISPFFKNIRKEITKSPMYYFNDLGLRNFVAGTFGLLYDDGFIFQNFIYNMLQQKIRDTSSKIFFWRTKDKAEIDFVLSTGSFTIPFEVKFKKMKAPEIPRAFRSFIERYNPPRAYIINLTLDEEIHLNKTAVYCIPFFKILQISLDE